MIQILLNENIRTVDWETTSENIRKAVIMYSDIKELAEVMKVNNSTVHGWCKNRRKPSIDIFIKLCHVLNVRTVDILAFEHNNNAS